MENKIKLSGKALYVKERTAKTGMVITNFMVECQNAEGYTSKIPVTGFGINTKIMDGDQITVFGSLRNAMIKNPDPAAKKDFRLEAIADRIEVLSGDVPF